VGGHALQLQNPCLAPEAPDQPGTMDGAGARRGGSRMVVSINVTSYDNAMVAASKYGNNRDGKSDGDESGCDEMARR
jgi:hypothetical protein